MNKDTLNYQILTRNDDEQTVSIRLYISENIPYFIGHFPDSPILPAVAIIDISHYFINLFFHRSQYKEVPYLKVKSKIAPQSYIQLDISQKSENNFEVLWQSHEAENSSIAAQMQINY